MPVTFRAFLAAAALFIAVGATNAFAQHEISVERGEDAVIVKSPISQGNFLLRVPLGYSRYEREDSGWLLEMAARADGGHGVLRLRISELAGADLRKDLDTLIAQRDDRFAVKPDKKDWIDRTGEGGRRLLRYPGKDYARAVLAVRDGSRLYELWHEATPKSGSLDKGFAALAEGFTILDPKGAPAIQPKDAAALKAAPLEHDYYKIKILKPAGFLVEEVDPESDLGIWTHIRREDEVRNVCNIRIRVFLTRTLKESLEDRAQEKITQFDGQHESARVPKRPKRTRVPGSKEAYHLKLVGKMPKGGLVVQEEWKIFQHDNGRTYEIQLTTYAGAQREFSKDIRAFWKSIKIRGD